MTRDKVLANIEIKLNSPVRTRNVQALSNQKLNQTIDVCSAKLMKDESATSVYMTYDPSNNDRSNSERRIKMSPRFELTTD